jgi:hypothetical protein
VGLFPEQLIAAPAKQAVWAVQEAQEEAGSKAARITKEKATIEIFMDLLLSHQKTEAARIRRSFDFCGLSYITSAGSSMQASPWGLGCRLASIGWVVAGR